MRIVFEVTGNIPGLAEEGGHLAMYLDGRDKPAVRFTEHGRGPMHRIKSEAEHLRFSYPKDLDVLRPLLPPSLRVCSPEDGTPTLELLG